MIARLLLVSSCACNSFFDLREAKHIDARGLDAPFACPPIGRAPVFARELHQIELRNCKDYTFSMSLGRAAAVCSSADRAGQGFIGEGPLDGELMPVLTNTPPQAWGNARLSPDGQRLYVQNQDGANTRFTIHTRVGDTFALTVTSPFPNGVISTIATVNGVDRLLHSLGSNILNELVDDGSWGSVRMHSAADLGLGTSAINFPNLSPDGLRLVFSAAPAGNFVDYQVWYADRPSVTDPFRTAVKLEGVPHTDRLSVMSDDCARVYFSGLDRMFYVQQL